MRGLLPLRPACWPSNRVSLAVQSTIIEFPFLPSKPSPLCSDRDICLCASLCSHGKETAGTPGTAWGKLTALGSDDGWLLTDLGRRVTSRCLTVLCPDPFWSWRQALLVGHDACESSQVLWQSHHSWWPHHQAQALVDTGVGWVWSQHYAACGEQCWCVFTPWLSSWMLLGARQW